jgi:hypothetical protein
MPDRSAANPCRWVIPVVVGAQLAVLGVAYGLVLFAHPQGDDFCLAVGTKRYGLVGAMTDTYTTWSGRITGLFVVYAYAALFDPVDGYGIRLAGMLTILLFASYMLVSSVLGRGLSTRVRALTACSLVVLHWTGTPGIGEAYYWWTGAVFNQLSLALAMLLVACLVRMPRVDRAGWWAIAIGASLPIAAGLVAATHELYGLILGGVLLLGTWVAVTTRHPNRLVWALTLAGAVGGLALVLLSPGNEIRMAVEAERLAALAERRPGGDNPLGVGGVLALAARLGFRYMRLWIFDAKLLSATIAFALGTAFLVVRPAWFDLSPVKWRFMIPVASIVALGVGFMAPIWALRGPMPQRTLSVLYLVFLLGWFLTIFVWTRWSDSDPVFRPSVAVRSIVGAAMLLFAVSIVTTGNMPAAMKDLWRTAPDYDRAMRSRYHDIRMAIAAGKTELRVAEVRNVPESFFPFDIMDDASHPEAWRNRCVAELAGVRSILVDRSMSLPKR